MENTYEINAKIFKALGNSSRLKIINMLSQGEMCACSILKEFNFTQPTLSHHMNVLMECKLVVCRKDGVWSYYSLNITNGNKLVLFLMNIITDTNDSIKENCF